MMFDGLLVFLLALEPLGLLHLDVSRVPTSDRENCWDLSEVKLRFLD